MIQLAIKGHLTRGEEVIEILEMLGGNNQHMYIADSDCFGFYINDKTKNIYYDWFYNLDKEDVTILTLEEFLEKYPYKIGDKVIYHESKAYIKSMRWDGIEIVYKVECNKELWDTTMFYLQPYKEENRNKANKVFFDANAQCCDITNSLIKEKTMEEELIPRIDFTNYCKDKYLIDLGDYEIKEENGKNYAVRKQTKYPKTYDECCDVLKIPNDERYIEIDVPLDYNKILYSFTELIICRNAYWKIAGEQMGLGKPWEPLFENCIIPHYCIFINHTGEVCNDCFYGSRCLLAFPTEEMRDTFYENFKDLIKECKEFL